MAELPQGINDRPALLMVKLGNLIVQRSEDPLAAMGLSGRQYMVLAVLSSDAPPSQLEPATREVVVDALSRSYNTPG